MITLECLVKTIIEDYTQHSRNYSYHRAGELEKNSAKYCKYVFSSDLIHIASNLRSFIQSSQKPNHTSENIELQK